MLKFDAVALLFLGFSCVIQEKVYKHTEAKV